MEPDPMSVAPCLDLSVTRPPSIPLSKYSLVTLESTHQASSPKDRRMCWISSLNESRSIFGSLHTHLRTARSSSFAFPSCSKLHSLGVSGSLFLGLMRLQCTVQYPFSLLLFCMVIVLVFVLIRGRSYFWSVFGHYKRHLLGWLALDRTGLHSVGVFQTVWLQWFWPMGHGLALVLERRIQMRIRECERCPFSRLP